MKKTLLVLLLIVTGSTAFAASPSSVAAPAVAKPAAKAEPAPLSPAAIRAKIAEIEKERATYLSQAERQLAAFEGAKQALEALLAPAKPAEVKATDPTGHTAPLPVPAAAPVQASVASPPAPPSTTVPYPTKPPGK